MFTILFVLMLTPIPWVLLQYATGRTQAAQTIDIEKAPFAVIVILNNNRYFCSGTIIDLRFVLTAAHCLYDLDGTFIEDDHSVTVLAGTDQLHYSTGGIESGDTQIRESERVIVYPQYSWSENFVHDLALIQLQRSFNLTKRVALVPIVGQPLGWPWLAKYESEYEDPYEERQAIHNYSDIFTMYTCDGYGFGRVMQVLDSAEDYHLKWQQYEVAKHCHCLENIRSSKSPHHILRKIRTFICHQRMDYSGLCMGDNGGQLMCEGQLVAVATAVFNFQNTDSCHPKTEQESKNECGDLRSLSVFTDVRYYMNWIKSHIQQLPISNNIDI